MSYNIFPKTLFQSQPSAEEILADQVLQKNFQDLAAEWTNANDMRYTPDHLRMARKVLIPFFIPDETMSGKLEHRVIAPGGNMMQAFTKDGHYMLKKDTQKFSQVLVFEEGQLRSLKHGMLQQLVASQQLKTAPVRGELHMLTFEQVVSLDKYKENGVKFHRKRIELTVPHRYKKQTEQGGLYYTPSISKNTTAWMYLANYEEHFEHWHMTDLKRILKSIPLVEAKVPYYFNL